MRKILSITAFAILLFSFCVFAGCAQQQNDSDSNSSSSQSFQSATSADSSSLSASSSMQASSSNKADEQSVQTSNDKSKEYYDHVYSVINGGTSSDDKKDISNKLADIQRIVEILPDNAGFISSYDLKNGSTKDAIIGYADNAKIFLDGKASNPEDLKVGDLVSYGGKTTRDSYPVQCPDVEYVYAWTANQDM